MYSINSIDQSYGKLFEIELFEHKCFILKGLLQTGQLKKHMDAIQVYHSLSNSALHEHRIMVNINKLYKYVGNCDYQQHYKSILGVAMGSTSEEFNETVKFHLINISLFKIQLQGNHSVNF